MELIAKKRSKLTLDGTACVDLADMAVVRLQGRTAKSVSFIVGRAYVVQEFRKIGEFWYSAKSHSTADVKFLGKTELIIDYVAYRIALKTGLTIDARHQSIAPRLPDIVVLRQCRLGSWTFKECTLCRKS